MPNNKKSNRRTQRRSKKKPQPLVMTGPSMLVTRRATLEWTGKIALVEGVANQGIFNFYRMNGVYDPDATGVGNSTPGLSSMAALYRSMRVWRCRVSASGTVYTTLSAVVSLVPTAFQPVLPSNPDYWPSQRDTVSVTPKSMSVVAASAYGFCFNIDQTYEPHVVAKLTKGQYADEADYSSTTTANPTRQLYVALAISTNGTAAAGCYGFMRITYEIEFFDPYPLQ